MTKKEGLEVVPHVELRPEEGRLDSWKEIAAYLRRGTRTVQRWEREAGLPVHRLRHEKLGSAYAYKSELDGWFAQRSVAAALKVKLTASEERELWTPPTTGIGAYDYNLRGRKYYSEYSPGAMELAIRMFLRAIVLDPNYAQAYAGLADCWSYLYLYSDRSEEVREQADWASSKAQEMDPHSAQAQASRGLSLSLGGRIEEADRAFDEAIRLDPELFEAHYFRARHCFVLGRLDQAAEAYANAMEARPDDFQSPLLAAQIEDSLGRHTRAIAFRKRGIGIAERHFEANPDDARALYMAANGLAALGDGVRSRQLADRALAIGPDDPMLLYNVGCIFTLLGLTEPALDCLEKAAGNGLTQKGWYEHDSDLNPLRADPRFRMLLQNMR